LPLFYYAPPVQGKTFLGNLSSASTAAQAMAARAKRCPCAGQYLKVFLGPVVEVEVWVPVAQEEEASSHPGRLSCG